MIITNHLYPTAEQTIAVGADKLTNITLGDLTVGTAQGHLRSGSCILSRTSCPAQNSGQASCSPWSAAAASAG